MKKIIAFALLSLVLTSCNRAVVLEYTVITERLENGETINDTITGNVISYASRYDGDWCLLGYDGYSYKIISNWSQGITRGNEIRLNTLIQDRVVYFGYKPVEYCKIGGGSKKIYPKEKRERYSKILLN